MAPETAVRATPRATQAEEWALVLAAAGIPHRLAPDGAGVTVLVPSDEVARARTVLDAYDEESQTAPHDTTPAGAPLPLAWTVGVGAAALLLAFFAVTGPATTRSEWFERGAGAAGRIVSGEPWRAVTALTLHADAVHVAGNALATAVLLAAVVQQLGPGGGLVLTLVAGTAGNVLAAASQDPRHVSVGVSTATFGAIGILAALRLVAPGPPTRPRRRRWTVLVTALLLLALLGAGRGADVLAHGLGLVSGGAVGLGARPLSRRPLDPLVQWPLAALAALAVVGCWRLALAGPGG